MSDLAKAINQTLEEAINRSAPADRLMSLLLLKQHLRGALAMLETCINEELVKSFDSLEQVASCN